MVLAEVGNGGIGKMRVRLAEEFARRGIALDLLLADTNSPYLDGLSSGVRVVDLHTSHALFSLPGLIRYLRRERPDLVLTQRIRVNVAALRARRLAGVKVPVWTTFNTNESAQLASLRPAKSRKHLALLKRWYPRNDGFISVGDGVADDAARLIGIPRERIATVYNPTVMPDLAERAAEPLDHPWFAPGTPPVVLAIGRLEPQKDFPTLLDAFALLHAQRPCRLVVLGEGRLRNALLTKAEHLGLAEEIQLPGFVDNPYAWLSRAALFALSSRWEGIANALVEAMACGTPVVATNCPNGPEEVLEGGRHGPLVPVGDARALAAAMDAVLDAPPPADRLRAATTRFTLKESAARYLQVLGLNES
jgi:glycosyltransferase involved in cell wall biosynthesis